MITRIWKEIRALAPWFVMIVVVGIVAVAFAQWFPPARLPGEPPAEVIARRIDMHDFQNFTKQAIEFMNKVMQIAGLLETALLVLAGSALFGAEFTDGSIQRLLAQPLSRDRIWYEKTMVLGTLVFISFIINMIILVSIFAYFMKIAAIYKLMGHPDPGFKAILITFAYHDLHPFPWEMLMVGFIAAATAPTLSLFLKQTHTTFWASLIAPIVGLLIVFGCLILLDKMFFGHGFSLLEWIMKSPYWIRSRPALDQGFYWQFMVPSIVWSAIVYPLGLWKFRRLEV